MTQKVDGVGKIVTLNPEVTAGAYHVNDNIGGKLTLPGVVLEDPGVAFLYGVCLVDAANQKKALEIVIFSANPAAATLTDNAAIAFSTDLAKVKARIPILSTDWVTIGGVAIADVVAPRVIAADSDMNLYAAIMAVEAPTFVAVTDLTLHFRFDRYKG